MLSVIVPVYNAKEFLPRCLDSLLNQGVEDYEVICVNDGSTDGSLEILNGYAERYTNIIRIVNQTNGGVSKARNTGLGAAQGDVIAFCDADDYLVPNAYRFLLKNCWHDGVDALKFNSVTLDDHMSKKWQEPEALSEVVVFEGCGQDFYRKFHPCFVWCYLYRKSFLDQYDLRFGQQGYAEDIAFSLDLFMHNPRCLAVDTNVYRYTISEQQLTRIRNKATMHKMVDDLLNLFQKMNDYAKMYKELAASLKDHQEQLMLSCISRILSADYDYHHWREVKDRLLLMDILPMHRLGRYAKFTNGMMRNFGIYKMSSLLYRVFFIPYILPRISRN